MLLFSSDDGNLVHISLRRTYCNCQNNCASQVMKINYLTRCRVIIIRPWSYSLVCKSGHGDTVAVRWLKPFQHEPRWIITTCIDAFIRRPVFSIVYPVTHELAIGIFLGKSVPPHQQVRCIRNACHS